MPTRSKHRCTKPARSTFKHLGPKPAPSMLPAAQVPAAVARLGQPSGVDRFDAARRLIATCEKSPARVYPHFGEIAALLESSCKIIRWNAIRMLALLAPADPDNRLAGVIDSYLALIQGDNMITAANTILAAAAIARARPEFSGRIIEAILGVEHATYQTPECRNVAIGHALDALRSLGDDVCGRAEVLAFISRQRSNPRPAVARRAQKMSQRGDARQRQVSP